MKVAIHQPQYLPWLGYFDKIRRADVFCFLDNVQYKKNEWQNRNRIKGTEGWQWLTVPVKYRFPEKINEVTVNNAVDWRKKHLRALATNYSKTPFFGEYVGVFEEAYVMAWGGLSELNIYLVEKTRELLGLKERRTVVASDLTLSDDPTDRLIDICQSVGGDTYLSGKDGASYMDLDRFRKRGIDVIFQDFNHPVYSQLYGEFVSHLSVVDLLFNCGPESLARISECNP